MAFVLAAETVPRREMTEPAGLYVHIPFCDAKCAYCDFVTFIDRAPQIDSYLAALSNELRAYKDVSLTTIFVGGGTPTVLSPAQIENLFSTIHSTFDVSRLGEVTVEANPESATPERLAAFQKAGVNRLSFGLQAAQDRLLGGLNRLHDFETFLSRYRMARSMGFENINVDLMFGLPDQSVDDWRQTLNAIINLSPEHVSAYALKVEPGTRLGRDGTDVDDDLQADMYLVASERLSAAGYTHYEISNFARPGRESRHNLLYWENKPTIGVGVSSTGYWNGARVKNTARLTDYIQAWLGHRQPPVETSSLNEPERFKESLMLGLRLKQGVQRALLERLDIPMLGTFLDRGLAVEKKGMYSLTPQGWLLSNTLFQYFV